MAAIAFSYADDRRREEWWTTLRKRLFLLCRRGSSADYWARSVAEAHA
jgi:hypothetical protein